MIARVAGLAMGGLFAIAVNSSFAYEIPTHRQLSRIAYDRSVLADGTKLAAFGVADSVKQVPTSRDETGTTRDAMELGAQYEDDVLPLPPRPFNHFFDPQNAGRGLDIPPLPVQVPSPRWMLDEDGTLDASQQFSARRARTYLYQAITSRQRADRVRSLGLTLESVGRVVHHLQDMAQPAHVRNDAHFALPGLPVPDVYEQWTNGHLAELPLVPVYSGNGVDLLRFPDSRSFWQNEGTGIAEFTSRNFVSDDTNFNETGGTIGTPADYLLPAAQPCAGTGLLRATDVRDPTLLGSSWPIVAQAWFVATPVEDLLLPLPASVTCNERTSTYAYFASLSGLESGPVFTYNSFNFRAAHSYLIPRAIAYSVGYINHFFRGRIGVEAVAREADTYRLVIRNRSAAGAALRRASAPNAPAEFEVWYHAPNDERLAAVVFEGASIAPGPGIAVDSAHQIRFSLPAGAIAGEQDSFTVVYRGVLGAEDGVAAQTFTVGDAAISVTPNYLPADGVPGTRSIRWTGADWQIAAASVQAGNTDWRGLRREDVVTWDGPASRYFYSAAQNGGISPQIYAGGSLLAVAPGNVLGAAIRYTNGYRELLAATYTAGALRVYGRRFSLSYPNHDPYHVANNPLGWRLLYSGVHAVPTSPFFFNGSGTEGQAMLENFQRVKVRLFATSASAVQLPMYGQGARTVTVSTTRVPVFNRFNCMTGVTSNGSTQETVGWNVPTVMCADYRGDQEALCQVDSEPSATETWSGTIDLPGGGDYDQRVTRNKTQSLHRMLRAGELVVPLTGTNNITNATSREWFLSTTDFGIDDDSTQTGRTHDIRILYLDVRNGLAAYSDRHETFRLQISDSYDFGPDETGFFRSWRVRTTSNLRARESRMIVSMNGQQTILGSVTTPLEDSTVTTRGNFEFQGWDCTRFVDPTNNTNTTTTQFNDLGFEFPRYVHPRALDANVSQGYAVDEAGNVAASSAIWIRQPNDTFVRTGTWNFLTNGTLPALLPGAGADPAYYPIGVIR